eukprot:10929874-Alexandrium_andersonii.AAC.1
MPAGPGPVGLPEEAITSTPLGDSWCLHWQRAPGGHGARAGCHPRRRGHQDPTLGGEASRAASA